MERLLPTDVNNPPMQERMSIRAPTFTRRLPIPDKECALEDCAKFCQGYLGRATMYGLKHVRYFKVVKLEGYWMLGWWDDKDDSDWKAAKRAIPMLNILTIIPETKSSTNFLIRYVDDINKKDECIDMYLTTCNDRSRAEWMDSIRLFISQLYLHIRKLQLRVIRGLEDDANKKRLSRRLTMR